MSPRTTSSIFLARFGVFELDLRTGELRKAGVRMPLPQQAFIVLVTLIERPNELVTREELRASLWPADTFVDFEHGLNAAIRRLREVLGDSATTPRYIETLPRRGYRFLLPVQRVSQGSGLAGPAGGPRHTIRRVVADWIVTLFRGSPSEAAPVVRESPLRRATFSQPEP
jgi:DNA-binding winged helix-turn-helix (wHTH) protein